MRLSKGEAKQRAIELAEECLRFRNEKPEWSWQCVDAHPDHFASDNKERKTFAKWSVIVEWRHRGNVVDGPGIIKVDIRNGTAET